MFERLFKGKTNKGEWVQGDLLHNGFDYDTAIWERESKLVTEVIPETVGQFTGLYDNTKWYDLTEAEKKEFYHSVYSEDGITIKYPTVESVEYLWKGKKIFEGDILYYPHILNFKLVTGVVVFEKDDFCFSLDIKKERDNTLFIQPLMYLSLYDCKKIGNIHDNPELLESEVTE